MTSAVALSTDRTDRRGFAGFLFGLVFVYSWVSINPYENLAHPVTGIAAINQLVGIALVLMLVIYALARGLMPLALRPRLLFVLTFGWLALACFANPDTVGALRRLTFTGSLAVGASLVLLLPRDREQFDRLIGRTALFVLFLCFAGVALLPSRSIHQPYDVWEPALAGDWRGVFGHKNIAAPAMVYLSFVGLYLMQSGARLRGGVITVLALVFLWMSNGKTALGLLPVALIIAHVLRRHPRWGGIVFLLLLGAITVFTLGSALSPAIFDFVASLGIDATFTARTDIWNLAITSAAQKPVFGYGFETLWGSAQLLTSAEARETWAVHAAHAHNGFLEVLLNGGVPALVLVIFWLVLTPLGNIRRAVARQADPALTNLFTRIWAFGILSALLESNFFAGTGPVWFTLMLAIFGLHQQAHVFLKVRQSNGG